MIKESSIHNTENEGFTIVELLVSLGIFSVVFLAIISFVLWANYYNAKTKADSQALENARRALDAMTYEIRGAESVYTSTTAANQLSLETKRYLPAGESRSFIDFFVCGTAVCLKKESQNPVALTPDSVQVTSLSFSQVLNGVKPSIQINMIVDYKNPNTSSGNYASASLTSTASLRKY